MSATTQERTIGILGGKGPEATVELLNLIIKNTPATREEDHLRVVVDNNPKVPKPSLGITGHGPCPVAALVATARNVERAGAGFIAIPCNSAHYYLDEIRRSVGIPVLSIIDETAAALQQAGIGRAGLLATTGLVQSELYQKRLAESGLVTLIPDPKQQAELMEKILRFKDAGDMAPLTGIALRICRELAESGAEGVVYACTEIPLALAGHPPPCPFFDTLAILAKACIREAQKRQGGKP